ncbi:hypothetical protein [Niallia taxi]|uniref:hypothetical protein n=1 Tax=Niallia taxi TaxID=2499688 RepID=UPI0015F45E51|nr:hypothetical protein [Niallia taxi]
MKLGHKDSQGLFLEMGKRLGYSPKKTYSEDLPTDGIWTIPHPLNLMDSLPVAAIEVAVSESPKTLRGSIRTLEDVSPLLAIILVHEGEITRRHIVKGGTLDSALKKISAIHNLLEREVLMSQQRFEIWTEHTLSRWYSIVHNRTTLRSEAK